MEVEELQNPVSLRGFVQKWKWRSSETKQFCEAPQREHQLQLYIIF